MQGIVFNAVFTLMKMKSGYLHYRRPHTTISWHILCPCTVDTRLYGTKMTSLIFGQDKAQTKMTLLTFGQDKAQTKMTSLTFGQDKAQSFSGRWHLQSINQRTKGLSCKTQRAQQRRVNINFFTFKRFETNLCVQAC